jgi:hypothetical protein
MVEHGWRPELIPLEWAKWTEDGDSFLDFLTSHCFLYINVESLSTHPELILHTHNTYKFKLYFILFFALHKIRIMSFVCKLHYAYMLAMYGRWLAREKMFSNCFESNAKYTCRLEVPDERKGNEKRRRDEKMRRKRRRIRNVDVVIAFVHQLSIRYGIQFWWAVCPCSH